MAVLLKICLGTFYNESRNYRELSAAQEAGYDVKVIAGVVNNHNENGRIEVVNGFYVNRFSTVPILSYKLPFESKDGMKSNLLQRIIRFLLRLPHLHRYVKIGKMYYWVKKVKSFNADVLSCHDIHALAIGYLARLMTAKKEKPKLIYDSHEFEIYRNAPQRTFIYKWILKKTEGFLIKRVDLSIMVTDSIADEIKILYKLKVRPLVIRSTPNYWDLDFDKIKERRKSYFTQLNASEDSLILMYHGFITPNRGIEIMINAVAKNPYCVGIILGYSNDDVYLDSLKNQANNLKIYNRILFLPAVPLNILWEYVGAADVGFLMSSNSFKSHYMALPNKFFENIQSLTPMICANAVEMKKIIEKYEIGLIVDPIDINSIYKAVEKMRTDFELYNKYKSNLTKAKEDLCWENEKEGLVNAYLTLKNK